MQGKKGTEIHRQGDNFYLCKDRKIIEKELLNYYSVPDVIEYLKRVHLLKIRGKTQFAEIPKKARKLIEKVGYVLLEEPITKKVKVTDQLNHAPDAPKFVPGEFLVTFKANVSEEIVNTINKKCGVSVKETIPCAPDHKVLSVPPSKSVEEMVSIYEGLPEVKYAEPNYIGHICMVPNDPKYPYQWHLDNDEYGGINMESAPLGYLHGFRCCSGCAGHWSGLRKSRSVLPSAGSGWHHLCSGL